ncbi:MAG: dihydroneopterin aldolase [Tannerella sp.]|jgi:dihydroneopterin aldolase|nr:dihydroneopterin aldolase [Tannerella sp.]
MKTIITLETMTFHAFHGVMEQERIIGGTYLADVSYAVETDAAETDNLADTINYAEVFEIVKTEMAIPSRLIEHVAGRIMKSIATSFPQINDLSVKISKLTPPLDGEVEKVTVELQQNC